MEVYKGGVQELCECVSVNVSVSVYACEYAWAWVCACVCMSVCEESCCRGKERGRRIQSATGNLLYRS